MLQMDDGSRPANWMREGLSLGAPTACTGGGVLVTKKIKFGYPSSTEGAKLDHAITRCRPDMINCRCMPILCTRLGELCNSSISWQETGYIFVVSINTWNNHFETAKLTSMKLQNFDCLKHFNQETLHYLNLYTVATAELWMFYIGDLALT